MHFAGPMLRVSAAWTAIVMIGGPCGATASAAGMVPIGTPAVALAMGAAAPSLLWTGTRQVAVNCLVQSSTIDTADLDASLCERVRALASQGAPVAVETVEPGDRAFVTGDAVVLLVHASIERTPAGRTFAFSIRPHRASSGEAETYYGTAPRAITLRSNDWESALDAELRAALAEILPWQQSAEPAARPL